MQQLLDWLTSGNPPSKEELEDLARQAGVRWANNPGEAQYITRRMLRQMRFAHLEEQMQQLMQKLQEMGMSQEAMEKLMGVVKANQEALTEQIAQQIGLQIAQDRAERPDELHGSDLMHKPFESLSSAETDILRKEVQRLVTQLRSRAALRRKRGKEGKFDAKGTIRFDDLAVDYAMTFEESPPSWEPPTLLTTSQSEGNVLDPTMVQVYVLEGEIIGPNTDVLRKITRFATDRTKVEIDCGRLRRMDFVTAGTLFNIVSQLHTQGRLVVFKNVNSMVAALMQVMGLHQVARIELRN